MFSIESIIGTLFSATAVRLASMALAIYVGAEAGSAVVDMLTTATGALNATMP